MQELNKRQFNSVHNNIKGAHKHQLRSEKLTKHERSPQFSPQRPATWDIVLPCCCCSGFCSFCAMDALSTLPPPHNTHHPPYYSAPPNKWIKYIIKKQRIVSRKYWSTSSYSNFFHINLCFRFMINCSFLLHSHVWSKFQVYKNI